MDPISSVDQLVLILRQRLLERSEARAAQRTATAPKRSPARRTDILQSLAAVEGLSDRQLGRALIQNILAGQFGRQVLNEAKFQQVVDQVTDALVAEPEAARLLGRVVSDLRSSAR